jgi:hypothetical protein
MDIWTGEQVYISTNNIVQMRTEWIEFNFRICAALALIDIGIAAMQPTDSQWILIYSVLVNCTLYMGQSPEPRA